MGSDVSVHIFCGETPHISAMAIAIPLKSLLNANVEALIDELIGKIAEK